MSGKKSFPKDTDLAGVESALRRAAKSARALAKRTKTPCYIVKDGKIVDIAESRKSTILSEKSSN